MSVYDIKTSKVGLRYKIFKQLSSGSFCTAYHGALKNSDNIPFHVCLKQIIQTTGVERTLNEIIILQKLEGKNFCSKLYEVIREGDRITLVMNYVPHLPFQTYHSNATTSVVKDYMRKLLTALSHVHANGIIHRDIKPGNFLYNIGGDCLLIDFGLATFEDKHVISRAGTKGYRAPEILIRYHEQTTKCDMWSVGVILLSFLTGRYPFFYPRDEISAVQELISVFGFDVVRNEMLSAYGRKITGSESIKVSPTGYKKSPKDWKDMCCKLYPSNPNEFPDSVYDLLHKLLQIDFRKRISAQEALEHPFLAN